MSVKPILIIQTGNATHSALQAHGDFAEWFRLGMGLSPQQITVCQVHQGEPLPDVQAVSGILITGSAAMVTERHAWSLGIQRWLEQALPLKKPILGVCYGHQLLVDLLGGEVAYNPKGRSLGSMALKFLPAAAHDPLFSTKQAQRSVYVSHLQSAQRLPADAVRLAFTEMDENHAFRYGDFLWGWQFHPEWSKDITRCYIGDRATDLRKEGLNPEKMSAAVDETAAQPEWLRAFSSKCLIEEAVV
ncbi:glutamine amidotransferase [Marinicella sp. W31]|uniref:glutamine amidotransferase n=1 Tax=Marinicella sp. W31 TaxID=3023713 RepID=UPI003756C2D4